MAFTLYELALNQDVQDKLREEIKEVTSRHNGNISYDAMVDMKYMDMVISGKCL